MSTAITPVRSIVCRGGPPRRLTTHAWCTQFGTECGHCDVGTCVPVLCARTMVLELEAAMWVSRVPTKENLADDPSRERYSLIAAMIGARECPPRLDRRFARPSSWEALALPACCGSAASAA